MTALGSLRSEAERVKVLLIERTTLIMGAAGAIHDQVGFNWTDTSAVIDSL